MQAHWRCPGTARSLLVYHTRPVFTAWHRNRGGRQTGEGKKNRRNTRGWGRKWSEADIYQGPFLRTLEDVFLFVFLVLDVIGMCVFKPSPECVSACVFSLCCLEDRRDYRDGHCAQASIWFLTHLFLVPYCLSIRHNGSQDSSPFYCDWRPVWRKKWKSISGSLFPGSWFWTQRTKTVFKEWNHFKGKRKSLCLQLSFSSLLFILAWTMWFSVGIWERGNNAFQVTWKVK